MSNPNRTRPVDILQSSRPAILFMPIWLLGNLVAWLGGASWRGIANRHERSLYQMSGFFVLLNGVIAWCLFTLAVLGIEEGTTFLGVAPFTSIWGLFVAAFDRAISAKIVDPAQGRSRTATGYVVRAICAVLLGFVVAEGGALFIFREDIARTMNDNISKQVRVAREEIVGTPDRPSERAKQLDDDKKERQALEDRVTETEQAYLRAEQLLLCERDPENCPPNIAGSGEVTGNEGEGPQTRTRQQQADSARAERDQAKTQQQLRAPDLDRAIKTAQEQLDEDLARAEDKARAANGLPARWRAMIDFTKQDSTAEYMHYMIIGLCVLLDLIPLLLKLWRGHTSYDLTVVASRERRERELVHQRQRHQESLDRELNRERIEQDLTLDLARLRSDSTLKVAAERQRVEMEKELERIRTEAESDTATPTETDNPAPPEPEPEAVFAAESEQKPDPVDESEADPVQETTEPEHPSEVVYAHPNGNGHRPPPTSTAPADRRGDARVPVRFPANWSAEDRKLINRTFGGRFVVTEPLGGADTGAFGRMLLAHDLQRGSQRVVIKAVRDVDRRFGRSRLRKMWQREVDTARSLHHSNIGEILTSGTEFGYLWTASPHYESGSLARWVESSLSDDPNGYPLKVTFQYVEQLADALVYAHRMNITHGDIKPTNAVLTGPRLRLVDWGFARATNRLEPEDTGPVGGTPLYSAPEVALRRNYNSELADLYSIGATWYFLLTGKAPYADGGTDAKLKTIAQRIKDGELVCDDLGRLLPNLPSAVTELVHALISPNPRERLLDDNGELAASQLRTAIDRADAAVRQSRESQVLVGPAAMSTGADDLPPTLVESQTTSFLAAHDLDDIPPVVERTVPIPVHLLLSDVHPSTPLDNRPPSPVPPTENVEDHEE